MRDDCVRENEVARAIVDVAVRVHRELGPGLMESVYERVVARELVKRGFEVHRQVAVPVVWDGETIDDAFRADLIVDGLMLVELKAVEQLAKVHFKQTRTYVKVSGLRLGLLLNFGCSLMKDGIHRIKNGMPE